MLRVNRTSSGVGRTDPTETFLFVFTAAAAAAATAAAAAAAAPGSTLTMLRVTHPSPSVPRILIFES